ncbi:MAG: acyl-CoA dehydrogenase family protein, partial [Pseudomonadales bacterium]
MDLSYSSEYRELAAQVALFLGDHWDVERTRDKAYVRDFRAKAIEAGYLYRSVPREYGGSEQSANVLMAQIIREEFKSVRAPREISNIGTTLVVPTLLEHGEEWQRAKFIRPIIEGKERWAQGYSEPGAGSDLASLTTRG